MSTDRTDLERRARLHAALADAARLRIVDVLSLGDASPSELAEILTAPSNLVAHHLGVLEREGIISRRRSEADRRRNYVRLVPGALDGIAPRDQRAVTRVVFVCTRNSARSHLAAALWRRASTVPATSAGTHPAEAIHPVALEVARRHRLDLPRVAPQHVDGMLGAGDLVISVCDRAHEELTTPIDIHWSVPDPVPAGNAKAFDDALEDLSHRVAALAPRLTHTP
ncbi:transcriptional regulator, ArsR family [Georgenia satyanarayanai]|uniref:Transcriptional regulator, ArsR family n=1 Tax=Georgenia satyanarayanai TaxID=860221 RepID=A0A2Y9C708_9MICO|nr:helix-turn-helix domain-containing protein [Georgenia satyanarayanai]PYF98981.1 ArsR family transcriptional regulator [Georgenia satyanarayanai]SSA43943.1 transcriptional regulator, ArsR family [Georgenia satyanarayanai]